MARQKATAKLLLSAERSKEAVALRLQGRTYDEIAAALGCGHGTAYRAVAGHLAATRAEAGETAQELREVELQRLDRLLAVVGPMAEGGDLQAVDRVLRIQERRSAYLGLDAPKAQLVAIDGRPDTVRALMALVAPAQDKRVADDVVEMNGGTDDR